MSEDITITVIILVIVRGKDLHVKAYSVLSNISSIDVAVAHLTKLHY
ncbi:hypothetical protein [Bartonella vinsonii]|nr:hypothetical protein [Bartonella vinsonii]